MSLKKVLAATALIVIASIGGGAVGYYLATMPKSTPPPSAAESNSTVVVVPRKQAQVRTTCYEGILYFTIWNNNAFDKPYISGAVIDADNQLPKRCSQ